MEDQFYTYKELDARVRVLAAELLSSLEPEERFVGIIAVQDLDTYAAILACWAAGRGYVPLSTLHPLERSLNIAKAAGLNTILVAMPCGLEEDLMDELPEALFLLTPNANKARARSFEYPEVSEEDYAYLLFTSGSTGQPKGVPVRHKQLNAFFENITDKAQYDFGPEDRFLQAFDLSFDLSVFSTFAPLCVGACCYVVPEDGVTFLNISYLLEAEEITVALMAPSVLNYLRKYFDEIRLPALRYSLFCGEALLQEQTEGWAECAPNAEIQNVYGPTEATIFCSRYVWTKARGAKDAVNGVVSIGEPLPGMRLRVVDEELSETNPGTPGQLALSGGQTAEAYWENPEKTRSAFVEIDGAAAYLTGDECRREPAGLLTFLGRLDQQVKIDGYRVELGEIEHHLRAAIGGINAVVFPVAAASGIMTLRACIEADSVNAAFLKAVLKKKLPHYMCPAQYRALPAFPLNANGKIDRKAIAARCSD